MNRAPIPLSRGDCFADASDFVARDGVLRDGGGNEVVAWPRELLRALHATLKAECGPARESILREAGKTWGRSLAQRIRRDLTAYHTIPLNNQPTAQVQASLSSAFARNGWGRVEFAFARHEQGLIEITVTNGPSTAWSDSATPAGDHLLTGILAGLFSELAGAELNCLQTDYEVVGAAPARFIVSLPQRLARVADIALQGQPHASVIAALESIQA
jgi:predicted hydrocarbon binding protein